MEDCVWTRRQLHVVYFLYICGFNYTQGQVAQTVLLLTAEVAIDRVEQDNYQA